jgi:Flp pilus assembly CpaF family ATPase
MSAEVDVHLVRDITGAVKRSLAEQWAERGRRGQLATDDERQLARDLIARQLDEMAERRLAAGLDPLPAHAEQVLAEQVLANAVGLGRLQPLLDDPDIQDIHVRGCDSTWVKERDGTRRPGSSIADSDDELIELIRLIAARLGRSERRFDAAAPELNFQLPDGSRLFAVMDVSTRPSLIIRKHLFSLSSLTQLHGRGLLDDVLQSFLVAAVRARRNIIITGGTGTGKTTLLRALINEVPRQERIVTIEDAYELAIDRFGDLHPDHDALQARPPNIEGRGEITMLDLAKMALRMDPDRVIIGEVRGGEAFPMILAMSQGNNGSMGTMHADASKSVFPKLAAYVSMADVSLPVETVNLLIATAVHFIVHIELIGGVRRIASVREVVDADGTRIVSNEVFAAGGDGVAAPAYAFRPATQRLLDGHGYRG